MLHELLFALNGYHGHTFMLLDGRFKVRFWDHFGDSLRVLDPWLTFPQVNEAIPYFHPAEVGILNQLLDIATDYYNIEAFIKEHSNTVLMSDGERKKAGLHGMYVLALCSGLEAVLEPYRQTLIDLEKTILKAKSTQLSFIQHKIVPYQPVMRNLQGLLHEIQYKKAHGCFILDLIYKATCSGVANVKEAMQRLLHEGHKVLYKQLLRWILQGSLYDPYEEFFVQCLSENPEELDRGAVGGGDDEAGVVGEKKPRVVKKFKLRVEMLPCHISIPTAEKIFFIGESIQLFERDRGMDSRGAVLMEKEQEFYGELAKLADSSEFKVADFERFVDSVRETASRHLHTLVLHLSDLRKELDTLRSFFLLGRGELFQAFIEEADTFLQSPPTAATQFGK